jgi:hypothetical protein
MPVKLLTILQRPYAGRVDAGDVKAFWGFALQLYTAKIRAVFGRDARFCVSTSGWRFALQLYTAKIRAVFGRDAKSCVSTSGWRFALQL